MGSDAIEVVHLPVMTEQVMGFLKPEEGGIFVDATVGPGGHSEELLKRLPPEGRLIAIDRDAEAIRLAGERLRDSRCLFKKAMFSELKEMIGGMEIDGMLFDLGVSMHQLKCSGRGFSFQKAEPLDMRMDDSQGITASDIVNSYSGEELASILYLYGEERLSRRIAREIVRARPIRDSLELAEIVASSVPGRGRIHPATKTFQALRIAVNNEFDELKNGLSAGLGALKSGGRLVVLSYHSMEDRIVKNFLKDAQGQSLLRILTKKPITPAEDETRRNPSSRSAKLRAGERL